MDGPLPEKRVFFLGSWKAPRLSDSLLYEISAFAHNIQGVPSIIQFTGDAIRTKVLDSNNETNMGFIPEKNVKEIRRTRLEPACFICVVKEDDQTLLNVMVWRCMTERDVDEILLRVRKSWSFTNGDYAVPKIESTTHVQTNSFDDMGEVSVNVGDFRTNRISASEQQNVNVTKVIYVPVAQPPSTPPIPPSSPPVPPSSPPVQQTSTAAQTFTFQQGASRDMAVQTDSVSEEHDTTGTEIMSVAQTEVLKDEIQHLTKEVELLKMVVESSEISKAEYYKRNIELNRQHSSEDERRTVYVPVVRKHDHLRASGHDIRSYGIQTDKVHLRNPRKLYEIHRKTKRPQHFVLVNKRSHKSNEAVARWRQSLPSYSSKSLPRDLRFSDSSVDNVFFEPEVQNNHEMQRGKKKVMGYVTLPPDNRTSYNAKQQPQQRQVVYSYHSPNNNFRSSTMVKKPIEEVYGHSKSKKSHVYKPAHRNTRQVITPYTYALEDEIPDKTLENGHVNGNETDYSSKHDSGLFIDKGFEHVDY